jgi:hypothetical protein
VIVGQNKKSNWLSGKYRELTPIEAVAVAENNSAVHGASDRTGAHPREGTGAPQDLMATIFHLLGIAPNSEVHDSQDRPIPVSRGEVIRPII